MYVCVVVRVYVCVCVRVYQSSERGLPSGYSQSLLIYHTLDPDGSLL